MGQHKYDATFGNNCPTCAKEDIPAPQLPTSSSPHTLSAPHWPHNQVQYSLSRYLKARLRKIERFVLHIAHTPDLFARLSLPEKKFAADFLDLVVSRRADSSWCSRT